VKPAFEHFQFKFDVYFVQKQILKINYIILLYHLNIIFNHSFILT